MPDILFVLITLLFFGGAALFVRACDRIIGSTEEPSQTEPSKDPAPSAVEPGATRLTASAS